MAFERKGLECGGASGAAALGDPVAFDCSTRRGRERAREVWAGVKVAGLDEAGLVRARAAGFEPGPEGFMVGRDPRKMVSAELRAMGHEPMSPMQAIRAKCLDCCGGSPNEVRLCVAAACPSWPYRMGSNPYHAPKTEAQLEAARKALEARRLRGSGAGMAGAATPIPAG